MTNTQEIKAIATALSKGDVDEAVRLKKDMASPMNKMVDLEITEVVRQSILMHLKKGEVTKAKEIQKIFDVAQNITDDIVQQAILSTFCDGDMDRLRHIRDALPITREIAKEIMTYCDSWGDKKKSLVMQDLFA